MNQYNSYAEAKIDNPDCEVYKVIPHKLNQEAWYTACNRDIHDSLRSDGEAFCCKPADYCMTFEQFFDAGHELVDGDLYLDGDVCTVGKEAPAAMVNTPCEFDCWRYILRVKALEPKLKLD